MGFSTLRTAQGQKDCGLSFGLEEFWLWLWSRCLGFYSPVMTVLCAMKLKLFGLFFYCFDC